MKSNLWIKINIKKKSESKFSHLWSCYQFWPLGAAEQPWEQKKTKLTDLRSALLALACSLLNHITLSDLTRDQKLVIHGPLPVRALPVCRSGSVKVQTNMRVLCQNLGCRLFRDKVLQTRAVRLAHGLRETGPEPRGAHCFPVGSSCASFWISRQTPWEKWSILSLCRFNVGLSAYWTQILSPFISVHTEIIFCFEIYDIHAHFNVEIIK